MEWWCGLLCGGVGRGVVRFCTVVVEVVAVDCGSIGCCLSAPVMAEPGSCFCAASGFDRGQIKGARSPGVGRKQHAL